jgi:hypothetical protein
VIYSYETHAPRESRVRHPPMNAQESWAFFVIGVILAGIAGISYYVAAGKLIKAGIKVKFLAMPSETIQTLRQYREKALERNWPLWPVYTFWVTSIPAVCAGFVAVVTVDRSQPLQSPRISVALMWVCVSSLLIALLFSYRASRQFSLGRLKTDDYLRNDVALAALGWLGFFASALWLATRS